jgi:hypothetical protein
MLLQLYCNEKTFTYNVLGLCSILLKNMLVHLKTEITKKNMKIKRRGYHQETGILSSVETCTDIMQHLIVTSLLTFMSLEVNLENYQSLLFFKTKSWRN